MLYVKVDSEKCCGFGICRHAGPDVYKRDEQGFTYVALETVAPELQAQARDGALACPLDAIYCDEVPPPQ